MRDGGRCRWETADGGVCGLTLRVQFAHRVPRARGGPPTIENVRLLCAVHNQYEARVDFGDDLMDRYTTSAAARTPHPEPHAAPPTGYARQQAATRRTEARG